MATHDLIFRGILTNIVSALAMLFADVSPEFF